MIDEQRTLEIYGYTSDGLSYGSKKPVVVVCEECGKYQVQRANRAQDICRSCKGRDPTTEATRKKIGDANRNPSKTTRMKMSVSRKRRVTTDETRELMRAAHTGNKNHNWKGGITLWRQLLYHSQAYKNWRAAVFERDNYTCQMCYDKKGGNLEAHHIRPVRDHKNDLLLLDINNGVTLCKDCHNKTKGREGDFIARFKE